MSSANNAAQCRSRRRLPRDVRHASSPRQITDAALEPRSRAARPGRRSGWGQLTAIGTVIVVPMMLVGLAVRRWLVTGLTMGAVTGE
ncbi:MULTISPECIES: hypothetical protein [unclassified Streptomyces]|uniref:hypothetical protein n=1 Tax=unclassified Streptomyces TaxID=2593676 RepID=UPI002E14B029|nr:hypothetical protein OG533_12815 [Streptomyces sp. NBC_01186]WSS41476.1 hypothetical protein OG220_13345 [Streptomyces sp. NBC_01187]